MPELQALLIALAAVAVAAVAGWGVSVLRRDVSIVDSLWSLMILLALLAYLAAAGPEGSRAWLVTALVTVWALRLSAYITLRNHGQPEDRRYQAIRRNNEPRFWLKSLYIVFLLQAFLAWVIALPAMMALDGPAPFSGVWDWAGVALWSLGMFFEVVGDGQLTRFRRSGRPGGVLETGLWRYTRHPNYFGEAVIWWGIWLLAGGAGAWWTAFAPALMSFLLLRVSGVALLERDIAERRPAYRDYVARTNAFFPWRPRSGDRRVSAEAGR